MPKSTVKHSSSGPEKEAAVPATSRWHIPCLTKTGTEGLLSSDISPPAMRLTKNDA